MNGEDDAGRLGSLDHGSRRQEITAERFLANHVDAARRRLVQESLMGVRRRCDVQQVRPNLIEHVGDVIEHRLDAETLLARPEDCLDRTNKHPPGARRQVATRRHSGTG